MVCKVLGPMLTGLPLTLLFCCAPWSYYALLVGVCSLGTPAMTSRGCLESDFEIIADFLFRAAQIANLVQRQKASIMGLQSNKDIVELRTRVENFATQFALPGVDV